MNSMHDSMTTRTQQTPEFLFLASNFVESQEHWLDYILGQS